MLIDEIFQLDSDECFPDDRDAEDPHAVSMERVGKLKRLGPAAGSNSWLMIPDDTAENQGFVLYHTVGSHFLV